MMPPPSARLLFDAFRSHLATISDNVPVGLGGAPAGADPKVGYLIVEPMSPRLSGSLSGDWPHLDQSVHVKAVADHSSKVSNLLDHVRELLEDHRAFTVEGMTVTGILFEVGTSQPREDDEGTVPLWWQSDRYTIKVS